MSTLENRRVLFIDDMLSIHADFRKIAIGSSFSKKGGAVSGTVQQVAAQPEFTDTAETLAKTRNVALLNDLVLDLEGDDASAYAQIPYAEKIL